MSSKMGNQDAGKGVAEEKAQKQPGGQNEDPQDKRDVRVTDKRRFSSEGDPVPDGESDELQSLPEEASEQRADSASEFEQLEARYKEAEEKRLEAERQVREFAERFRLAQAQLKAETDEQRARMQRAFDQKLEAARGDVVAGLLDTLDNLKRALAAADKSEQREADFDALLEGLRATAALFEAKMLSLGLVPLISVGEEFNPEFHEAVEIVAAPPDQDNLVVDEYQTGYKFGDRLLRPARVRVGRAGK
jgi:molecular chaperone GrpE